MRTIWLLSWLMLLLVTTDLAEVERGTPTEYSIAPGDRGGPVYLDSADILLLESYPVQVQLLVRGALPTPCHKAVWEVQDTGVAIDVLIWSEADPTVACAQVLEPFEASIPLGSFESADLPVLINGEAIERLVIGPQPAGDGMALVGAGWSFGMCAGYCTADLAVHGHELTLTGGGHIIEEPLYLNRGALTALGSLRIAAAIEALSGVALEPVYGCPDCADGGAAYLTLAQDGTTSRHDIEFGHPPEQLADLSALTMALMGALETCTSDELVDIAEDCMPRPER